MNTNLQSISDRRATRTGSLGLLVPREGLDTQPFDAQERDEIVVRYFYLGQSIQMISETFARRGKHVGHKVYQNVIRFGFFRAVGKRRKDMADRGSVAA